MRIIMMGTGPFAVPTFRSLYDSRHEVVALVTQPARPAVGKGPAPVNPMRAVAVERGSAVFDPQSVNTPEARADLAQFEPDLFVVCDYGQILAPETLAVARLGGVNLHASLLPKYRGAAPINWALYHDETVTGVSVIHLNARVDAGPVIAMSSTPIGENETAVELEPRLAELGAPLVVACVDDLEAGRAQPIDQDPAQATRARRLKKSDSLIDWRRSAAEIRNQIRALKPWPKTSTNWSKPGRPTMRLIIDEARAVPGDASQEPGVVINATADCLIVATGGGALAINALQPEGKKLMKTADFLRGYPVAPGDRFGADA